MTNQDETTKIHELIKEFSPSTSLGDFGMKELMCMKLLEWHKKNLTEKVAKWLEENCNVKNYLDWDDWDECSIDAYSLIYDFKEAIEKGEI